MTQHITTTIRSMPDSRMLVVENRGEPINLAPGDTVMHHDANGRPVFTVEYLWPGEGDGETRRTGIEVLAHIRCTSFGVSQGLPQLSFTLEVNPALVHRQWFTGDDALKLLREHEVSDITDLNGRLCWVELLGGEMRFLRLEPEEDDEEDCE